MKVYEAIARGLSDMGCTELFGVLGDGCVYIIDSFRRDCNGHYVAAVHEGSAVLMAQGWARVAGKVGVAAVTHGPGLTNTITPLVEGVKAGTPMVLLAGDTPAIDREHAQNVNQRGPGNRGRRLGAGVLPRPCRASTDRAQYPGRVSVGGS